MPAKTAQQEQQEMMERARQDIEDIGVLRKTTAFERYWMRRLKQRRDEVADQFKYLEPEKCSPARREELRQILLVYEKLLTQMDVDDASARQTYQGQA